jgi:hypothetical protein
MTKSTWSPLYRGLLPAAACGPPGKKRFGKPWVCSPRNVVGPSAPVLHELPAVPAPDTRAAVRACAEVEAGRPHDHVELRHPVRRLDAVPVIRTIGVSRTSTNDTFGSLNASK